MTVMRTAGLQVTNHLVLKSNENMLQMTLILGFTTRAKPWLHHFKTHHKDMLQLKLKHCMK